MIKQVQIKSYNPFKEQLLVHQSPARFRVVIAGRRFGKSYMAVAESLRILAENFNRTKSYERVWFIAPTYPLVEEDWRIAERMFEELITEKQIAKMRLILNPIGEIEFKSADSADTSLRGAGLIGAVLDEAARISQDAWEYGIRPALSDKIGRAILISTPKGMNWLYDLYCQGQEQVNDIKSWQFPSNIRPSFPQSEWKELRKTQAQRVFSQEYMAEFLQDGGSVFNLDFSLVDEPLRCLAHPDEDYSIGVDLAKTEDFFVVAVVSNQTKTLIDLHRSNQRSWNFMRQIILEYSRKYNNARVILDSSGVGDPIEEDLRRSGIYIKGFKFTNTSKCELIERLMVIFEQGLIRIPKTEETKWLIDELNMFESESLPSGMISYHAPGSRHDDGVIALALAIYGARLDLYEPIKMADIAKPQGMTYGEYAKMAVDWKQYLQELPPLTQDLMKAYGTVLHGIN